MDLTIVSRKPQTTRRNIRLILTTDEYQMIFIDTPGLHKPRTKLGEHMVKSARSSVREADATILMTDAKDAKIREQDAELIGYMKEAGIPVILAINKIDLVNKDEILPLIELFSKESDFAGIIPVSAKSGDGKEALLAELVKLLPEGGRLYPDNMITDQTEREIVAEKIREKALRLLNEEIPHGIGIEIERFKLNEEKRLYEIDAVIYCEKDSHKSIIIGKNGVVLKRIGTEARYDAERILGERVFLQLWVKVKKDWRNRGHMLKTLGYTE
jgi:GTP-binding protein Era